MGERSEWEALRELWLAGVPVPYPVQIDGTEILMELVVDPESPDLGPAPRLAATRPEPDRLASYAEQVRDLLGALARRGIAHGDLSPYNVLAAGDRLVVIDLPQVVDIVANPTGTDFLHARLPHHGVLVHPSRAGRSTPRTCSPTCSRRRTDREASGMLAG